MIDYPREIPRGTTVQDQADTLADSLDEITDTMQTVMSRWGQLGSVYQTPESTNVYQAMFVPDNLVTDLGVVLVSAHTALSTFAGVLTDLNNLRPQLVEDVEDYFEMDPADPEWGDVGYDLDDRLWRFDLDLDMADEDCARALDGLRMFVNLPISDVVTGLQQDEQGFFRDGLAEYLGYLEDQAATRLNTTTVTTVFDVTTVRIVDIIPDSIRDGVAYSRTPSGFLVPTAQLTGLQLSPPRGIVVESVTITSTNLHGALPVLPVWIRRAGRALPVAAFGIAFFGHMSDEYNELLVEDPYMSESDRWNQAINYGLYMAGAETIGGLVGPIAVAAIFGLAGLPTGPGAAVTAAIGALIGGYLGATGAGELADILWDATH